MALLFYLILVVLVSIFFLASVDVFYVILALWPPAVQYQLPALLFVCVLFVSFSFFVVVLSGEPKQNQGRWLVDRELV